MKASTPLLTLEELYHGLSRGQRRELTRVFGREPRDFPLWEQGRLIRYLALRGDGVSRRKAHRAVMAIPRAEVLDGIRVGPGNDDQVADVIRSDDGASTEGGV